MSRWLQNVGSFLDQLDTKAAVVVTSAVSGRDNATDLNDDDDDDDDLDHNVFNHTTNIETRLYQPTNTTSIISNEDITSDMNNAYKNDDDDDDDDCHDANDNGSGDAVVLNDPNRNIETRIQPIISSSQSPFGDDGINNDDNDQINYSSILLNQGTTNSPVVVTSIPDVVPSSSNMEIEIDGWKNDDMIDDITERSNITTLSTNGGKEPDNIQSHPHPHNTNKIESSNETVHDETAVVATAAAADDDDVPESNQQPESTLSPTPISTTTTTTTTTSDATSTIEILTHNDISSTDQTKHFVERIARLEQEVRQYQNQLHQIRQEKQNEVYVITKEARTLRRHLATINEQLVMADREVGAQRQELENAAQRFEMDQIKYKQDVLAIQSKHQYDIQQIKLSHQEAMTNLQAQSQNQMDVLKKELSDIRQQRQQEGGDWNKELTEAIQREHMVRNECQALIDERDTLLGQIDTLRSQQELLGNRLESLTAIADNAAIREREAEVQLDNAMTLHAKQLNQRQAREAELERTVSELSAMLVIERSKHTNMMSVHEMVPSSSNDTTSSSSSSYKAEDDAAVEIETMKSQLEIERQHNSSLKKEIDDIVRERQEEILLAQTRQAQHEKKISELTQQLMELRATIRDVKQQDMTLQQRQTDESKLDAQRVQELSEELIRMRERMSVSNSETAALRNRLQAALNRAIVAEAAAESAFHSSELNTAWSGNNSNNDLEQGGITVRRRGTTNQRTSNSKSSSSDVPTIRKALRLDGTQGGIGRRAQGIGKSLDMLDGFLAQSGEILRFNAIARLCFVVYLLLLHVWTFVLLTFHIHGFEAIHGSLDRSGVQPHGPGALMQQAAIVNAPNGN